MRETTAMWLGLVMVLGTAGILGAEGGRSLGGPFGPAEMERLHEHRLERVAEFLDLSDRQIEEWRALHESRFDGRRERHDEMRALHERIRELASAEDPDATAVGELVIQAHREMEAVRAEREAVHEELLSILTPEQRERFEALQDLRGDRPMRGPHGRGRHSHRHGPAELD